MRPLLFATTNAHKTGEVRAMLGNAWQVDNLNAHPQLPAPDETGDTFEANAILKALSASAALPGWLVLADDSGLDVDALNGQPGVRSARYAGPDASDADNRALLISTLTTLAKGDPGARFPARFHCCLALALDGKMLCTQAGSVEGAIQLREQGSGGFGYDSLFIPQGYDGTFGLLPAEVKNQLSHRARALEALAIWLRANPV